MQEFYSYSSSESSRRYTTSEKPRGDLQLVFNTRRGAVKVATVVRNARIEMEQVIGEKVITSVKAKVIHQSIENKNENE